MDIFLTIIAAFFIFLGIIGSFIPVLPGPLTSWVGLLILHLTDAVTMDCTFLITTLVIAIIIWIIDYIIPVLGTKKFGGSRAGMFGTLAGLFIAIFFPIFGFFGIIIWLFIGALVGELLNKTETDTAVKAAFGSLIGFLTGAFLKFVVAVIYLGLFFVKVWEYKSAIFTLNLS